MYWLHTLCKRHVCLNQYYFLYQEYGVFTTIKNVIQCNCATGAPKILAIHHDYAENLSDNPPTEWLFLRSRLVTAGSALCAAK